MRKFTCILSGLMIVGLFFITTQRADAQSYGGSETTFGIKVGPNFSNMTGKDLDPKPKIKVGLQGGFYANIPIASQFYVQPSLMYEGKGAQSDEGGGKEKVNLNYITLPIDFLFKPEMPNGSGAWIIGVGPYFGYGFSGKVSMSGLDGGIDDIDIDPFKKGEIADGIALFKRFDAGANIQLGYEMANGFNITLNGNLGLVNIAANDDNGNVSVDSGNMKNTSFGLLLGYSF